MCSLWAAAFIPQEFCWHRLRAYLSFSWHICLLKVIEFAGSSYNHFFLPEFFFFKKERCLWEQYLYLKLFSSFPSIRINLQKYQGPAFWFSVIGKAVYVLLLPLGDESVSDFIWSCVKNDIKLGSCVSWHSWIMCFCSM